MLIAVLCALVPAVASAKPATTGEFAEDFVKLMGAKEGPDHSYYVDLPSSNPYFSYIAGMGYAFPGTSFDGKQMHANPDKAITSEAVFKSFVYFRTFLLPDAVEAAKLVHEKVPNFDSLGYSADGVPYLACLLKFGMDPSWIKANRPLERPDEVELLTKLAKAYKDRPLQTAAASPPTVISNVETQLAQPYYPDGPVQNQFTVSAKLGPAYNLHQFTSILGTVDLQTPNTEYGIGVWGQARNSVSTGKVVGGFFTASGVGEGVKGQLVGSEIDVINNARPGESKRSTSGLQVVTIGSANSTAAMQIISDNRSRWDHGIIIEDNAMSRDATIFGVAQSQPVKVGIDMSNTSFTDAAIHLKSGQMIKWNSADLKHGASLQLSDSDYFVVNSGPKGFAIKAGDWVTNLFIVDNNGDVELEKGNLVMSSPNGSKFKISVDDNGVLKTTRVSGPSAKK